MVKTWTLRGGGHPCWPNANFVHPPIPMTHSRAQLPSLGGFVRMLRLLSRHLTPLFGDPPPPTHTHPSSSSPSRRTERALPQWACAFLCVAPRLTKHSRDSVAARPTQKFKDGAQPGVRVASRGPLSLHKERESSLQTRYPGKYRRRRPITW